MVRQTRTLEQKLQNVLRDCQKRDGNKRCADCTERLPQWVIINFNTFVCTACSGIHREFTHRVKSISLAKFTEEEVEGVKQGGNIVNNKLYMAKYKPGQDLPEPEGGRPEKHREFIRAKYVDKLWYATPEDLKLEAEREAEREVEREAAKAKRESARSSRNLTKRERMGAGVGPVLAATSGENSRARRTAIDRSSSRRVSPPPGSVAAPSPKTPPAPSKPVAPEPAADLLDFLSDTSVPVPAAAATSVAQQTGHLSAPQPWNAFGSGDSGDGFATATATTAAAAPPPQQPQSSGFGQGWAAFEDAPGAAPATAPVAGMVGMQSQQAPTPFSTNASNGTAGGDGGAAFAASFSQAPFPAPQSLGVAGAGQEPMPFADSQLPQNQGWSQAQPTGPNGTGASMGPASGVQASASVFPHMSPQAQQPQQQQIQHPPTPSPALHGRRPSTGGEPTPNQQAFGQNLGGFASLPSPARAQAQQQHVGAVGAMGPQQPLRGSEQRP